MKQNKNIIFNSLALVVVVLIEIFLYFQMIYSKDTFTIKYKIVYLILCMLANIGSIICLYKLNRTEKTEKKFLFIASIFGMLYLVFVPVILGTDELPHFLRPYQISVGDVLIKDPVNNITKIPKNLYAITSNSIKISQRYSKSFLFEKVNYKDTTNIWNGDVTSFNYSPIPYMPQVIGFWVSRLLNLSPLLTVFMVRFCNFITWLTLGYFSIKLLPAKKNFATLLYCSPAVLSLVSTCSGDTLSLGLMLLLFSYVLNLSQNKKKVTKKDIILLFLMCIGISTYKMFYVFLTLFLFIIPKECFDNSLKKKLFVCGGIVFFSLFLDGFWYYLNSIGSIVSGNSRVDQLFFVLKNPLKFLYIFINTFINDIFYYFSNLIAGNEMCYGLVRINDVFIIAYLVLFLLSLFSEEKPINIDKSSKILIALVCLLIFGLVSSALYLDMNINQVGGLKINGIQSRYFFSLIIPLSYLIPIQKLKINMNKKVYFILVWLNVLLFVNAIQSLLIRLSE